MKVAVLGYGTVGVGVYEMLQAAKGLEAGPVLVRPGKENEAFKVSSIEKITGDPSVDAVAEVMGGVEPAFTYAMAAIRAGKHFVTSNKALVAAKGVELNRAAKEAGVSFLFSAACGGGVPFLHEDFKKRGGFALSVRRSAELGLYRQNYCGCEFSRKERNNG